MQLLPVDELDPQPLVDTMTKALATLLDDLSRRGDAPALVDLRDDTHWSGAELVRRVERAARVLGDVNGGRVAIVAEAHREWLVAFLAAVKCGAVPVPVDAELDDERLEALMEDAGVAAAFVDEEADDRLERLGVSRRIRIDVPEEHGEGARESPDPDGVPRERRRPDEDVAVLFFTSGTTGRPKGVPLSHENLAFQLDVVRDADLLGERDRVLVPLPLHHVYPLVIGVLAPLAVGSTVVLPAARTARELRRALHDAAPTVMIGVPRLYRTMLAAVRDRGRLLATAVSAAAWLARRLHLPTGVAMAPLRRRIAPELRLAVSGGAALSAETEWALRGLGFQVVSGYGLTETAPLVALNRPGDARPGSAGRPVEGVEVSIADDDEVLVRGPNLFSGYLDRPEEDEEAFTSENGRRWFRTGDLGRIDEDGYLHLFGRASTRIVTGSGKNVQAEHLEEVLEAAPAVEEIGVLEHDDALAALAVPARGAGEDDVVQAIRDRSRALPSHERISRVVVTREALPRTRLGKIRRRALEERFERAAGEGAGERPLPFDEMTGEDRDLLREPAARRVWDWLVERHPDIRLTPDTRPRRDLGVDSLEWMRWSLELGRRAGIDLSDESLGDDASVRDLLRAAGEGRTPDLSRPDELLTDEQMDALEDPGPLQRAVSRVLRAIGRVVVRATVRLEVSGLDHVGDDGPLVLAPNHRSYLDPFVLGAALGERRLRRTWWAAWTGVAYRNALLRGASRLLRVIPVDPEGAALRSVARGVAVLKRERILVWFPEGERSEDGTLGPFREGIGLVLHHAGADVVPVWIAGTHEALPPSRRWPRLGRKVRVVFGDRVSAARLEEEGEGENTEERIVAALRERVAGLGE